MFQFAWPWMFLCLPLPYLIWRFTPPAPRVGGAIRVPFFSELQGKADAMGRRRPAIYTLLLVLCWLLLLGAAARPQWLGDITAVPSSGRNLMLAVDVSGSMKTRDLEFGGRAVDRLSVVKYLGADFLKRRTGDRVGLILFGSNAYLQSPLTFDRATVGTLLEESLIGIAGERTAIGDAIGLSIKRLRQGEAEQRVLVLLTDGANTAGSVQPAEAARLAAAENLKIHTIGIGADRMRVNSLFGAREVNPSAELDEILLTEIADLTGGRYFRAKSTRSLEDIYEVLDSLEPVPQQDRTARRVDEYFHWLLAMLAIVLTGWLSIGLLPVAVTEIFPVAVNREKRIGE